ncbi:MAG TPA: hypothetical protein DEE98_06460 [Elusimicrobia bacterium]|nr:MAG: hypothetical protein A2278_02360 [Elusimicrobia bacterium RIFOXYA12_FULL_49_49]OGS06227.1 MAG: hypothetical protein A2204_02280 [Elusimicrobia bacterium RIFOXYA1_FULL_47_7]OGS11295.1 MAG: hypothetical protein A2386_04655 [Elusimicrobia bacterium RIFOXYB1_FULL_48_9]OGS16890.1 MAG: hypothetical protein A2251_05810 [Elusimicrobia bacterium RIFOXYA2_FULL_47_53]OGS32118.1 MAG: hypothetical protein A2323_08585 [Elusimicrobia bacterium RIFOXYB2_FULL_46_23]HBU70013.1 hypothetical protein [Elus
MKINKNRFNNRYLKDISFASDKLGIRTYLVGGAVRDILLGGKTRDIDVVSEINPHKLVKYLSEKWRVKVVSHPRFMTYTLSPAKNAHIDFVTARNEVYPAPARLPVVAPGTLRDDMLRRDFTINALAASLSGSDFGTVSDFTGGLKDLGAKTLRVIHGNSFRDDPTRIFRLARFASRGYRIEGKTAKLAAESCTFVSGLSAERVREEILEILEDNNPYAAMKLLVKWGVLSVVFPQAGVSALKGVKTGASIAVKLRALTAHLDSGTREKVLKDLRIARGLKSGVRAIAGKNKKPLLTGKDLINLGYKPGPSFKDILTAINNGAFKSKKDAISLLFDKFPKNR